MLDEIVFSYQYIDMKCPFCGSSQIMVTNSRPTMGDSETWRRRKCLTCDDTFTTYEKISLSHLIVIKKSGRKQKYNRAKLYSGIYHSSVDKKDCDRGDMSKFARETTNRVEQEILNLKKKEIRSTEITEIVLDILMKKTPDIFLRFLAYREGDNKKKMKQLIRKHLFST